MPEISVIVPVYKIEPYIRECIESILNQTFTDFELILVDDGSPDKCPQICDEYARKDNRVIVIHKQNGGLSSARNEGLDYVFANSSSKYISFIDGDDYIHQSFLMTHFEEISSCDLSICYYEKINEKDADFSNDPVEKTKSFILTSDDAWDFNFPDFSFVVSWNKLYRRDVFLGLRFPTGKNNEDGFILHWLMGKVNYIKVIPQKLYFYRFRHDSIMNMSDRESILSKHLNTIDICADRAKYFTFVKPNKKRMIESYNIAMSELKRYYFNLNNNKRLMACIRELKLVYKYNLKEKNIRFSFSSSFLFFAPRLYFSLRRVYVSFKKKV